MSKVVTFLDTNNNILITKKKNINNSKPIKKKSNYIYY